MLADRFTFFAQVVNFLILVWLLRKFLFRPILKAVDEREAGLEAVRKDAEAARTAATAEKQELEARRAEFENGRADLLRRAEAEAEAHKGKLLEQARSEAAAERAKWERGLAEARRSRADAWTRFIRKEAFSMAAAALREIADADLEAACVGVFLRKLEGLDAERRSALTPEQGPAGPDWGLAVRTSFAMGQEPGAALAAGLRRILATDAPVRISTDPALALGIELEACGRTLSWTVPDALDDLEARAGEAMEAQRGVP